MPSWIWHCLSHFALCVISSVCLLIRPLLKEPVPKLTSLIYLSFMAVNDAIAFFLFFFFPFTTWALFLPPLFTVQWQLHPWLDRECATAKPGAQFLYPECFPLLICVSYLFVWDNQLQHLVMGMSEVLFGCMIYHNCLLTSLFPQLCSVDVFLHALDLTWT